MMMIQKHRSQQYRKRPRMKRTRKGDEVPIRKKQIEGGTIVFKDKINPGGERGSGRGQMGRDMYYCTVMNDGYWADGTGGRVAREREQAESRDR